MGHVRDSIQINAPPEAVFDVAIDARRWPEWQTTAVEVTGVEGPLDAVGKTYNIVGKIAGRRIEGSGRVTKLERPRLFEITGTAPGGGRLVSRSMVEPEDGGSRVTIEIDYELPGGFLGQLAGSFVSRQVEREMRHSSENLKALIEEGGRTAG